MVSNTLRTVIVDCEGAAVSAFEAIFGPDGVEVQLCLFHWIRCIKRQAEDASASLKVFRVDFELNST